MIAVLAGISFVSCDDMLDVVPRDRMTPDTFFKNESELKAFTIKLYTIFPASDL